MTKTWFISDTHFGHSKTTDGSFKRADGTNLRPFKDADEMDFEMMRRWNERVDHKDRVYHLGDVVIARKNLWKLSQLNGRKALVRGNHDVFHTEDYIKIGFDEIYGVKVLSDMILSHIPLHPRCVTDRFNVNVHGHLHANDMEDGRYLNVSVEHIDYTPITIEEVRARVEEKRKKYPIILSRDG
mgnify:CR=1 FL=1